LFLLPLKALVADKRRHFEAVYGGFGLRIFEATGETDDISPILRGQYDVGLLTYEKFSAISLTHPHVLQQAGVVVVDEAQMVADRSRGAWSSSSPSSACAADKASSRRRSPFWLSQ
jgi:helicase